MSEEQLKRFWTAFAKAYTGEENLEAFNRLAGKFACLDLGASRETIVADFDATNQVYEADVKKYTRRVKFWGGGEEEIGVVKAFLGCNTDNFVKALDRIDREYGSLDAYLKGPIGLTDDDIRVLMERYLE